MHYFITTLTDDIHKRWFFHTFTTGVFAFAAFFICSFFLFLLNTSLLMLEWKKDIKIIAYLTPNTTLDKIFEVQTELFDLKEVRNVNFIEKNDLLPFFEKSKTQNLTVIKYIQSTALPNMFEIHLKPIKKWIELEYIAIKIGARDIIDGIEHPFFKIKSVENSISIIKKFGIIISIISFAIAFYAILNMVQVSYHTQQKKLSLMQLMGATHLFLKLPFYARGILQSFLGCVFGLCFLFFLVKQISAGIHRDPILNSFELTFFSFNHLLAIILTSMMIGGLGCHISLKRYL